MPSAAHRFGDALVDGDLQRMMSMTSTDVVFYSPVIHRPGFEGRHAVEVLLSIVVEQVTQRELIHVLEADGCVAFVLAAQVRGKAIRATALVELDDDGLAREIWVMARPLIGAVGIVVAIASGLVGRRSAVVGSAVVVGLAPLTGLAAMVNRVGGRLIATLNREQALDRGPAGGSGHIPADHDRSADQAG